MSFLILLIDAAIRAHSMDDFPSGEIEPMCKAHITGFEGRFDLGACLAKLSHAGGLEDGAADATALREVLVGGVGDGVDGEAGYVAAPERDFVVELLGVRELGFFGG